MKKILRVLSLFFYYGFARCLPASYLPLGRIAKGMRGVLCRNLFRSCGKDVNVEHGAYFQGGKNVELGDYSAIGIDCKIYGHVSIGKSVLMGPEVMIFSSNHRFDDVKIPINQQGFTEHKPPIIGDNVWIGARVIILPGARIGSGSIIGAGAVVTKDIPSNAVAGGNPARVIKYRTLVQADA